MLFSAMLQSKLQRRLFLQGEAGTLSAWQRCEARRQIQSVEAMAVARSAALGDMIARLRFGTEVLRRDLEVAQDEAHRLWKSSTSEGRRNGTLKEESGRADREPEQAEGRRETLLVKVEDSSAERFALDGDVDALEGDVHEQIHHRVRFEARLRESQEAELGRLLEAARARVDRQSEGKTGCVASFSLDGDSDSDTDDHDEDESGRMDLEFTYEVLELNSIMCLDEALRLAQRRFGRRASQEDSEFDSASMDLEFSYEGLELSGTMCLDEALQLAKRRFGRRASRKDSE